jgi:hypothetical protein
MVYKIDEKENCKVREVSEYLSRKGYDKGINPKFKVGDVIQFLTGYDYNILAEAKIKGINGNDLYVYNDAYWFAIQDNEQRKIRIIQA